MDIAVGRRRDHVPRSLSPYSRRTGGVRELSNNNSTPDSRGHEESLQVHAPVFLQRFHGVEASLPLQREIRFEARVDGLPKPEVVWYKDGIRILEGHGRYGFQSGPDGWFSLVIPEVLRSDYGSFICEASNTAGKARCIAKLVLTQEAGRDIPNRGRPSPKLSETVQRSGSSVSSGNILQSVRTVSAALAGGRNSRRSASNESSSKETHLSRSRADPVDDKHNQTSKWPPNYKSRKTSEKEEDYLGRLSSPDRTDVRTKASSKRSVSADPRNRRRSPSVERVSRKFENPKRTTPNLVRKKDIITMVRSRQNISSLTAKFESSQDNASSKGGTAQKSPKPKLLRCESIGKSSLDSKRSRFNSDGGNDLQQTKKADKVTKTLPSGRIPIVSHVPGGTSSLVSKFQNEYETDSKVGLRSSKFQPSPFQKVADKASIIAKFETSSSVNQQEKERDVGSEQLSPKNPPTQQPTSPQPVHTTDLDFSPPCFVERPNDCSGVEQGLVRLSCRVDGSPKPRVTWHFKGSSLKDGARYNSYEEGGQHTLEIHDLQSSDAGLYTCRVQNPSGRLSASVKIEVTDGPHSTQQGRPPIFLQKMSNVDVSGSNQSARFECQVTGMPRPEVTWLFDDDPIVEGTKHTIERREDGLCALTINDVTCEDDAFYTCVARNGHGEVRCSAELLVDIGETDAAVTSSGVHLEDDLHEKQSEDNYKYVGNRGTTSNKAPAFVSQPQSLVVSPPEPAHFSCIARGRPEPEITWSKNGVRLVSGDRYNIHTEEGMSLLKIYATSAEDVGSYVCEARNRIGTVEATFDVGIDAGVPSPTSPGKALMPGNQLQDDPAMNHQDPEFQITVSVAPESESAPPNNGDQRIIPTDDDLTQLLSASSITQSFPPTFIEAPRSATTAGGSMAEFSCVAQGYPKPTVSWARDGERIVAGSRVEIGGEGDGRSYLRIRDVRAEDGGEYVCFLVNSDGTVSASADLVVEAVNSPPTFIEEPRDCDVKDGDKAVFTCKVKGSPVPTVRWLFREHPLHSDGEVYVVTQVDDVSTLTLPDVILDDEGDYVASATNSVGEVRCTAKLSVRAPPPRPVRKMSTGVAPSFTQSLEDVEAVDGVPLSLAVRVAGKPKPSMNWFLNEVAITADEDFKFVTDGDRYSLVIAEVFPDDGGRYTCRITNDRGTTECSANVVVKESVPVGTPPSFIQKPGSISTDEGSSVSLVCQIAGDHPITLTWSKDGKPIECSKRFSLETSGTDGSTRSLHIPAVLATDAGSYQCTIENKYGVEESMASLVVKELEMEQTDFRSLLKTRPRLQDLQNSSNNTSTKSGQLDFRHVLTRHVKQNKRPCISGYLSNLKVEEGNPAVFECSIDGHPEPKVLWYHQSKEIKASKFFRMTYQENVARLEISEAFSEDEGEYVCEAVNSAGETKCRAKLDVKRTDGETNYFSERRQSRTSPQPMVNELGSVSSNTSVNNNRHGSISSVTSEDLPPRKLSSPPQSTLNGRDSVSSNASVYNNRHASISSVTSVNNNRHGSISSVTSEDPPPRKLSSTLNIVLSPPSPIRVESIPPVTIEIDAHSIDSGIIPSYANELTHLTGQICDICKERPIATELVLSRSENVLSRPEGFHQTSVPEGKAPGFSSELRDIHFAEGAEVRLRCRIVGDPKPEVTWFKGEVKVRDGRKYRLEVMEEEVTLVIRDAREMDAGTYRLIAENSVGRVETSAELFMTAPPRILEAPGPITVVVGETASIQCRYSGTPSPLAKWKKMRRRVQTSDRYAITTTETGSVLTIKNVNEMDAGRYTLTVTNDLGSDEANVSLIVVGQPDPPVGKPVVRNVDSTSLVLSWAGSSYDGGSPITGYHVEARMEGAEGNANSEWCQVGYASETQLSVTSLESEALYRFRVRATNCYGIGDPGRATDPIQTGRNGESSSSNAGQPRFRLSSATSLELQNSISIRTEEGFSKYYDVQDEIGRGKFGTVYTCLEKASGNKMAAKFVPVTPRKKADVRNEIEVMSELDHPRLMRCFDAFEEARQMVIVLEYLSGGELFERIVDDDEGFLLTECDVIRYVRQVCEGVRHMHERGVLHLDLKPENIMCVDQSGKNVKLIDFGLARRFTGREDIKVLSGTPEFVAPEVVNFDTVGFKTDMWSVGILAYTLLSGLSPFMGDTDADTLSNVTRGDWDFEDEAFDVVSREAKDFISKLLVKAKEKRLSAKQALDHRWLRQPTYSTRTSQTKLCTDKLKKFVSRRKWQKSANVVMAVNRLSLQTSDHPEPSEKSDLSPRSQADSCNGSVTLSNDKSRDTDDDSMASTLSTTSAYSSGAVSTNRGADSPLGTTSVPQRDRTDSGHSHTTKVENEEKFSAPGIAPGVAAKPCFTKTIVDCIVFEGDCARFDCVVKGAPETEVTWYLDDEEIEGSERFFMEYDEEGLHSLIIRNTNEDDEGDYVVIAKNQAGQVSCAAELLVEPTANGI